MTASASERPPAIRSRKSTRSPWRVRAAAGPTTLSITDEASFEMVIKSLARRQPGPTDPPSGGGGDAIRVRDRATRRCRHRRDHRPADRVRVEQPLAVQFQRTELGVDEAFDVVGSDSDLVVVPHAPELLALREEEVGEVRCSGTGTAQRDDPAQARGVHPGEERVVLGRVQLPDGSGRVSGGSRASRCSVSDVTGVDIEDIGPGADAGAPVSVVLSQTSVAALVRLSSVVSSAALRASSATVSAVSAPARSAADHDVVVGEMAVQQ
jgi:hypothetical protein